MSQNENFAYQVFSMKKAIWPAILQQPVNASSRRIGMKTARPNVDFRPH